MRLSYEGEPPALEWLGKAQQELERLQARMDLAGRTQGTFQHVLSDTAYCYGYILPNGIRAVHIVNAPAPPESVYPVATGMPDFVSGLVIGGELTPAAGANVAARGRTYYPTAQTCVMHKKEVGSTAYQAEELPRLAVPLWGGFDQSDNPVVQFTQYASIKPTLYSGKMRKVVQAVLGFGRRVKPSLYDALFGYTVPPPPSNDVPTLLGVRPLYPPETPSEYANTTAQNGVQVRFDYRFARTHGIVTAADGKLWLVEIGMNHGVLAMPLPLWPHTDDAKFRQHLVELGDADGLTFIDTFGGFPSGEAFPTSGPAINAWIRAGRLLQLVQPADLEEFYQHNAYSQSMGWAFSESGHEAHNTAYNWSDTTGVQFGVHYMIPFAIGGEVAVTPQPGAAGLARAFASLKADYPDTFDAAMWKLPRLTAEQYAEVSNASSLRAKFLALDAIVATPLASGSAHLSKVSQGDIYWTSLYSPQIKFPDYGLGFLISHDMRPDKPNAQFSGRCDTTMHVFFIGDELHWCKFFFDQHQDTASTQRSGDDPFDIAYSPVGHFVETYTYGPLGIPAMFYTNQFDDRALLGTATDFNEYKRYDEGVYETLGKVDGVGDRILPDWPPGPAGPLDPPFPYGFGGVLGPDDFIGWQNKRFRWETSAAHTAFPHLGAAIAVPLGDRCAYYYGKMVGDNGVTYSFDKHWWPMRSPYLAYYGIDGRTGVALNDGTDIIIMSLYNTIVDDSVPYQRYQDYADDGDWVPIGAKIDDIVTNTPININAGAYTEHWSTPGSRTLTVQLVASEQEGPFQTYTETRTGADATLWDSWWFLPSPDPETGLVATIKETQNALGESASIVFDKTLNGAGDLRGKPDFPAMLGTAPTFIGVVDG